MNKSTHRCVKHNKGGCNVVAVVKNGHVVQRKSEPHNHDPDNISIVYRILRSNIAFRMFREYINETDAKKMELELIESCSNENVLQVIPYLPKFWTFGTEVGAEKLFYAPYSEVPWDDILADDFDLDKSIKIQSAKRSERLSKPGRWVPTGSLNPEKLEFNTICTDCGVIITTKGERFIHEKECIAKFSVSNYKYNIKINLTHKVIFNDIT